MDKDPVITSPQQAVQLVKDIEIIVCTNLAHCYIQVKEYHHAIKYCSQALEKDAGNSKALYRMGIAYT